MRRTALLWAAGAVVIAGLLLVRHVVVDGPLERLARDGTAYAGSWHFPRGGPYILGYDAPAPARLVINGRQVAAGAGRQSARVVYEPGVYAVRFEAPDGARLLWHPPGRRGPAEYVSPSSLSPLPPGEARFGARAGAAIADGLIAIAIVLVVLATVLLSLWPRVRRIDRQVVAGFAAVLLVALAARLIGLSDAGQTWDEDVNWSAGKNYVTNLLSLDFRQASWTWNYEHPPVMKYVAGIGAQLDDGYGPARALSALWAALACALLVPIGARLASLRVGILAGAVAALTPHLIAHGKVVGHEAPTMFFWTLAVWVCLWARARPDETWQRLAGRFAVVGLVLGLAVFSRFVNALMAPLIATVLLVSAPAGLRVRTLWVGLAVIPVTSMAVGFLIWPRLWSTPISHLSESWAKLRKPHGVEPYLGTLTNQPPRTYFAVYLYATAPLGVVLAAGAALVRAAVRARREWRASVIVLAWLIVPLAVAASPVRQDGVRYIMPSLLALSLLAALGVDTLADQARARARAAFFALGGALCAYLFVVCVRVHPYYLDYYGEQVGGPARVAEHKRFEIAWWGEGLDRAIAYVNEHAAPGDRVFKGYPCVVPGHLAWLRADLWAREARSPTSAEWILVYAPSTGQCRVPADARLVHEVRAQGAPLARVYWRGAARDR